MKVFEDKTDRYGRSMFVFSGVRTLMRSTHGFNNTIRAINSEWCSTVQVMSFRSRTGSFMFTFLTSLQRKLWHTVTSSELMKKHGRASIEEAYK